MPQMAPLSWAPLMALITVTLMIISAILFWAENNPQTTTTEPKESNKMNWKW